MKVIHLSLSPIGGAGQVAEKLSASLVELGVDSTFKYVMKKNLSQDPLRHPVQSVAAGIDEYIIKTKSTPLIISPLRAKLSKRDIFSELIGSNADIIHLHWVQGVLTISQISLLVQAGKKVVWTLHDMAPFTGGCHHSYNCENFQSDCKNCPQMKSKFQFVATHTLAEKVAHQDAIDQITFVTPSQWMAKKANESKLLWGRNPIVIPNPVSSFSKHQFIVPRNKVKDIAANHVGVMVANNLAEPNKNISRIVSLIKKLNGETPDLISLSLVGNGGEVFHEPEKGIYFVGPKTQSEIFEIFGSADFYVTASLAESFSLSTAEAIASGVFAYVNANGAAEELVDKQTHGAVYRDIDDLENLIRGGAHVQSGPVKDQLTLPFDSVSVARMYMDLYVSILEPDKR